MFRCKIYQSNISKKFTPISTILNHLFGRKIYFKHLTNKRFSQRFLSPLFVVSLVLVCMAFYDSMHVHFCLLMIILIMMIMNTLVHLFWKGWCDLLLNISLLYSPTFPLFVVWISLVQSSNQIVLFNLPAFLVITLSSSFICAL